jgi:hypothetical protein
LSKQSLAKTPFLDPLGQGPPVGRQLDEPVRACGLSGPLAGAFAETLLFIASSDKNFRPASNSRPKSRILPLWIGDDKSFGNYLPLFASNKRILSVGLRGELILVDAQADSFKVVSRLRRFEDGPSNQTQLPGHPALINTWLFLRRENELVCAELVSAAK